jgi:AhpD family alkylhydroperoxidase
MSEDVKAFYKKFEGDAEKMKKMTPNMIAGFGGLFQKVMGEGKLTVREKELIAVGIAVAIQCKPCILLHVKKCLASGATKEEILEAAQVSVMMAGGPGYTHMPEVIDALEANE